MRFQTIVIFCVNHPWMFNKLRSFVINNMIPIFGAPRIIYGRGSLAQISKLVTGKALIITDPQLNRLGFPERLAPYLKVEFRIFDGVPTEPDLESLQNGLRLMDEFDPEFLIGLGGGSVLDYTKGLAILHDNPGLKLESLSPISPVKRITKLIAIPTTSGTGSDATYAIVFKSKGRKLGFGCYELIPDYSILDPELVAQLPKELILDTGIDALSHALEALVSVMGNIFTRGLALQSACTIWEHLPRSLNQDQISREQMHYAATLAGLAFGNSHVGIAHSLGHALGGIFNIPHGRCVGVFLPYVIQYNSRLDWVRERYSQLCKLLGIDELSSELFELYRRLGFPVKLSEIISDAQFMESKSQLVRNALADICTWGNPRNVDRKSMEAILECSWKGARVEF